MGNIMISIIQSGRFEWSPLDLSPDLWLDASDESSFAYHSGTLVSQWSDKSGNDYHATQATSGNAPSRSTTLNGLSTVDFDGVDNWLTCGDVLDLGTNSLTMYVVVKFDAVATPTTAPTVIGKYKASPYAGSYLIISEHATTAKLHAFYNPGTNTFASTGTFSDTSGTLIGEIVDRSTGSITLRVDASTGGTTAFTPDAASSRDHSTYLYLGGLRNSGDSGFLPGFWLDGQIAEVVTCLRVITDDERDKLEQHLNNKWAVY
jgi:hypothetical protein